MPDSARHPTRATASPGTLLVVKSDEYEEVPIFGDRGLCFDFVIGGTTCIVLEWLDITTFSGRTLVNCLFPSGEVGSLRHENARFP